MTHDWDSASGYCRRCAAWDNWAAGQCLATKRKDCGCIFGAECCGACKGEKRALEVEKRRRRGLPSEFPPGPYGDAEEAAWLQPEEMAA